MNSITLGPTRMKHCLGSTICLWKEYTGFSHNLKTFKDDNSNKKKVFLTVRSSWFSKQVINMKRNAKSGLIVLEALLPLFSSLLSALHDVVFYFLFLF